ncbi:MAG: COX15/CtaA family protein [Betaproteobacteria bacterium]|nr:COX15/CtaA family protein [Betaproteobacteria bacterium]
MSGIERGIIGLITLAFIAGAFWWVGRDSARFTRLIRATTVLTFVLIVLGAFVRLSDAGLGCPDWPGCYGNLTPAHSVDDIRAAEAQQPGGPVTLAKAWKEMVHRYLAMIVGSLIAAITFAAIRNRGAWHQSITLPVVLSASVIFQAALGAWTVTLLLKPAIVTSHLLGGVLILAMLVWLWQRQREAGAWASPVFDAVPLRGVALVALSVVFAQITLGGWVSTNYAALACADLPTCHGAWMPPMDFANAFHIIRPLGVGPDGELLTHEALRAIHWTHRVGAIVTALIVGSFAWRLYRIASGRSTARMLAALLILQIVLGLLNVAWSLPLPVAVMHNGVAALLFAFVLLINLRIAKGVR